MVAEDLLSGALLEVLRSAQTHGFIGDGDLLPHVRHALGFAHAVGDIAPERGLDLGSGGGLPGLVLALHWPQRQAPSAWVLLDAGEQRTRFLTDAVDELGLGERVQVVRGRAEELARDAAFDEAFDLVVARSFGPPAVVAECAARFLRVGGRLVVSEPPEQEPTEQEPTEQEPTGPRWDHPDELAALGLTAVSVSSGEHGRYQVLEKHGPTEERYPRRVGVPTKRPLF